MPAIRPITELQRNITGITEECRRTKEPLYLTKNGTASLVVMDAKAFDAEMRIHHDVLDREMRVHKALLRGYEDAQLGRTRSLANAREEAVLLRNAPGKVPA